MVETIRTESGKLVKHKADIICPSCDSQRVVLVEDHVSDDSHGLLEWVIEDSWFECQACKMCWEDDTAEPYDPSMM
jgi:transposase-like protein